MTKKQAGQVEDAYALMRERNWRVISYADGRSWAIMHAENDSDMIAACRPLAQVAGWTCMDGRELDPSTPPGALVFVPMYVVDRLCVAAVVGHGYARPKEAD